MSRRAALVAHRLAGATPTGIGRYYIELLRALASAAPPAGYDIVAATTRETAPVDWLPRPIERRQVPGPRKAVALLWALFGRPRADAYLGNPDIVHALQVWTAVPVRAPFVATIHDLAPIRFPAWYAPAERWLARRGLAHARDHARLIITVSETAAAQITELLGVARERIRVVPLGVGKEFHRRPDRDEIARTCATHGLRPGRYLIAVGAVSPRKNLSVVLRAIKRLPTGMLDNTALVVAGPSGLGAGSIHAEVDALELRHRVRFIGHVDNKLPALIRGAMALVHPSRDESFGFPPLEAMAAGVPALTGTGGALPEITGGAAVMIDPDDVDAWTASIARVACDGGYRAALVEAGSRRVKEYTWERTAAGTLAVYDEALGGPA